MINLEIPDRSTIGLAHPLILLRTSWQKFAAVPNKLPSCLELQIEQRTRQTEAARKSRAGVPAWENSLRTHGDSMAFKTFKKFNNIDRAAAAHPVVGCAGDRVKRPEDTKVDEQLKTHGAFSWCELMTTDANAAKDFYTKLFGWTTEEMSVTPGMTYTVVKVGGKGIGGIMSMPSQAPGMPPYWACYVTVADVDAVAKNAQQLGGKILMGPQDIPTVGRFCVIQDPQGAVISAITYANP